MTTDKGLQVWLPLIKDLHNQGLNGTQPVATGTPSFSATGGKLGGCYSFNNGKFTLSKGVESTDTSFTITFWIKITTGGTYIPYGQRISGSGAGIMILINTSYFYFDDGTRWNTSFPTALSLNTWYHLCFTRTPSGKKLYVNGKKVLETTTVGNYNGRTTKCTIGGDTLDNNYNLKGNMNDFRLYSYALSPQEIKELSRGKVGHWLGDRNGTALPNLFNVGIYRELHTDGSRVTKGTINSIPKATILANKGKTLCLSFISKSQGTYTKGTMDGRWGIHGAIKINTGSGLKQEYPLCLFTPGKNGLYYGTWTIPSNLTDCTDLTWSDCSNGHTRSSFDATPNEQTWYLYNYKLELGTIPSAYSSSNQAFLSDISGFGRHGQIVGNVTLSGDTPRYDKSLKYNGGNVVVTGLPTMSTYTISWWDKFPAGTGLLFDWRLGPVDTTMHSSSAGAVINNNTCYFQIGGVTTDYQNYSNYDITANTWYHCCLVCDDSKSRLYINGIQKWEASKGSIADFSQLILGGRNAAANDGYQYTGQHSDFRIYATALSADDVKELYSLGH